jgi:hypothetical protein
VVDTHRYSPVPASRKTSNPDFVALNDLRCPEFRTILLFRRRQQSPQCCPYSPGKIPARNCVCASKGAPEASPSDSDPFPNAPRTERPVRAQEGPGAPQESRRTTRTARRTTAPLRRPKGLQGIQSIPSGGSIVGNSRDYGKISR